MVSVIKQFIGIESISTYIVVDEHDGSGECHHQQQAVPVAPVVGLFERRVDGDHRDEVRGVEAPQHEGHQDAGPTGLASNETVNFIILNRRTKS